MNPEEEKKRWRSRVGEEKMKKKNKKKKRGKTKKKKEPIETFHVSNLCGVKPKFEIKISLAIIGHVMMFGFFF